MRRRRGAQSTNNLSSNTPSISIPHKDLNPKPEKDKKKPKKGGEFTKESHKTQKWFNICCSYRVSQSWTNGSTGLSSSPQMRHFAQCYSSKEKSPRQAMRGLDGTGGSIVRSLRLPMHPNLPMDLIQAFRKTLQVHSLLALPTWSSQHHLWVSLIPIMDRMQELVLY